VGDCMLRDGRRPSDATVAADTALDVDVSWACVKSMKFGLGLLAAGSGEFLDRRGTRCGEVPAVRSIGRVEELPGSLPLRTGLSGEVSLRFLSKLPLDDARDPSFEGEFESCVFVLRGGGGGTASRRAGGESIEEQS